MNCPAYSLEDKVRLLAPIVRGWRNYHKYTKLDGSRFSLWDMKKAACRVLHKMKSLSRYVKRTHPNKSKGWTQNKYWGRFNFQRPNDKWVFGDKNKGAYMLKFSWFNIKRHPLIEKKSSPDDPKLKDYWEKRQKKSGESESEKFNKIQQKVGKRQEYRCPICGNSLFNDEPLHLHHKIPRCQGGKDEIKNLLWLHQFCHHKVHYQN